MDKKFLVSFGAEKRRFDHAQNPQSQFPAERRDPVDHLLMQLGILDNAPFPNLSLAHLKLGLNQANKDPPLPSKIREDGEGTFRSK